MRISGFECQRWGFAFKKFGTSDASEVVNCWDWLSASLNQGNHSMRRKLNILNPRRFKMIKEILIYVLKEFFL